MPQFITTHIVTLLLFLVRHGQTLHECQDPAFKSEVFLDLPKLQLLSIKYSDSFKSPLKCSLANSTAQCANQICCSDEIGCCFGDPNRTGQTCGCKKKTDVECARSAPLAVLRNYGCDSAKRGEISMCLRTNLEGEITKNSFTVASAMASGKDDNPVCSGTVYLLQSNLGVSGTLLGRTLGGMMHCNNDDIDKHLAHYTVDQLEEMLDPQVLLELTNRVSRRQKTVV